MKVILLVALALAGRAETGLAQNRSGPTEDRGLGGRGFFLIGFQQLGLDDLNGALVDAGYPRLDQGHLTLGGGGFGTRGRWLIGGEGHVVIGRSASTSDGAFRTQLAGGYGVLDLGYLAYSERSLDIYPMVGLGGGGVGLSITERGSPTFGEVLDDPGRSAHLTTGSLLVNLGLGVDYRIPLKSRSRGGLLLGVRVGWMIAAAGGSDWTLDDRFDVSGGPKTGLGGPYVQFAIGGWGRHGR